MSSAILPTVPVGPVGHAPDMRANFAAAKSEIEALQAAIAALEIAVDALGLGVADGTDAAPGDVGEFRFVSLPTSSAVALPSGAVRDIVSLDLPAGDWDIQGAVNTSGSSSNVNDIVVWVSDQSATRPPTDDLSWFYVSEINFGTGGQSGADTRTQLMTGLVRVLSAQTTTVYLSCAITFSGGTCLASGAIRARRMR